MDDDDMLMLLLDNEERKRRPWCRPALLKREERGEFRAFMEAERTSDPNSFYGAYRMSPSRFDELVEAVGPRLQRQRTNYRKPISPAERMAIAIRFVPMNYNQTRYFFTS